MLAVREPADQYDVRTPDDDNSPPACIFFGDAKNSASAGDGLPGFRDRIVGSNR